MLTFRSRFPRWGRWAATLLVGATLALVSPAMPARAASVFTFSGFGWGHGLGMSQWGARGLAEQGRSFQEILGFYYSGTSVQTHPTPPQVRVGILWDRFDSIEVRGSGSMEFSAPGFNAAVPALETWSVAATSDGRFRLGRADGSEAGVTGSEASPLLLRFEEFGSLLTLSDAGRRYRSGVAEFNVYRPTAGEPYRLRLVLTIPGIDRYLYGLGEMPSSWPAEALKAQATAARSYAVEKIERLGQNRPVCNCALYATTLDQAYVGYDKEASSLGHLWVAAVDSTSGQVTSSGGRPIQAYYHSSSGGSTENNEEVWGGSPISYLRARVDRWSNHPSNSNSLWTVSFSEADLAARLGLQRIYGVNLSDRTTGGGIREARVSGNDGNQDVVLSLSGGDLRARLGLRSIKFNLHQFGEFLLLFNPGDGTASVNLTLMFPDRPPASSGPYSIPPRSRKTLAVNPLAPGSDVSIRVSSNEPIAAERSMYFFVPGADDGHAARASPQPSLHWYFAEGATHSGFGEFLLLNNPDPAQTAIVDIIFSTPSGQTTVPGIVVSPARRRTISVDEFVPNDDVSVTVSSRDVPVVAERAMYFAVRDGDGYPLVDGGTVSEGATAPSERWYLAEGATHSGFSTFVLVQNPNGDTVQIALDLFAPDGLAKTITRDMPPGSRVTVSLNDELPGADVSTVVRSITPGRGVVAERSMYFVQGLLDGGTASLGAPAPSERWYLAEGATHSGFSTFVLVQNPNPEPVTVSLDLFTPAGSAGSLQRDLPPYSRTTVSLNAVLPGEDVSTVVRSLTPGRGVVAERAVYLGGRGIDGGHAVLGVPEISTTWYFAEGFTGW